MEEAIDTEAPDYGVGVLGESVQVRGMAGKFVDTSAIRKSNALLKKRFA